MLFQALNSLPDNNYCELAQWPQNDNFASWDAWAKQSPNPNVKIYMGAAASSTAAHTGYLPIAQLTTQIQQTKAQYSSFGGVMFWDASQAYSKPIARQHVT